MTTLLVVDTDLVLQQAYRRIFTRFSVVVASDGHASLYQLQTKNPDLLLLELQLPDIDGLVLLGRIRRNNNVPIIVVSGRDTQADRVLALTTGADDFVRKPFEIDDLEARVDAVLRRSARVPVPKEPLALTLGPVTSSVRGGTTFAGKPFHVTQTEQRLLQALLAQPGQTVTRTALAQQVWGYDDSSSSKMVDVHVGRLRRRLLHRGPTAPRIITTRGRGLSIVEAER